MTIREDIGSIVSGKLGISQKLHTRKISSIKFKIKARRKRFSEENIGHMLQNYQNFGPIEYVADFNPPKRRKLYIFSLLLLAGSIGHFTRNESFHTMNFMLNIELTLHYREYTRS
eukprot:snap_masked-scaffold_35-processed-gene-2.38-mRNA-1 protein AED:1.00 eAED:1.00 QI:0/0/0/0/1/1/2/0/114